MTPISRAEIIARARSWLRAPRRYSQDDIDPESGYRMDCSGYASMAWCLEAPGLTTVELPDLCDVIAVSDLRPGDAVMNGGPGTDGDAGHIILFAEWTGETYSRFQAYEQVSRGTIHHERLFPPSPPYLAYRYRGLSED